MENPDRVPEMSILWVNEFIREGLHESELDRFTDVDVRYWGITQRVLDLLRQVEDGAIDPLSAQRLWTKMQDNSSSLSCLPERISALDVDDGFGDLFNTMSEWQGGPRWTILSDISLFDYDLSRVQEGPICPFDLLAEIGDAVVDADIILVWLDSPKSDSVLYTIKSDIVSFGLDTPFTIAGTNLPVAEISLLPFPEEHMEGKELIKAFAPPEELLQEIWDAVDREHKLTGLPHADILAKGDW